MEYELDLLNIIQNIFGNQPQPPKSIQLTFDMDEIPPNEDYNHYIFEQLLIIFVEGLKIYLKSDIIHINEISEKQFQIIQTYFNSFGFKIVLKIEKIINEDKIDNYIDSEELPSLKMSKNIIKSVLKDYVFSKSIDNTRYNISFDYFY